MLHKVTLADLAGKHNLTLASSSTGSKTLVAQLRIDRDGYSMWFVVYHAGKPQESQSFATAIRIYNELP